MSVIEDDDEDDEDEQQVEEQVQGVPHAETSGRRQDASDATSSAIVEGARPRFIIRIPVPPFADTEEEEEEEEHADEGDGSTRRSKRRRVAR